MKLNWGKNATNPEVLAPAFQSFDKMKDKIDQVDIFILNIYSNKECRETLTALYDMTFPDLVKLHNYLSFKASLTTLQQHAQHLKLEQIHNSK